MAMLSHYFGKLGPGAALAVAVDGAEPRFECRGLADIGQGREITPDTVFDLASASKTFTAAAVMLLAERGLLELKQPIHDLLDKIERPKHGRPIAIEDLLRHTSGLQDYLEEGMYTPADRVTPDSISERLPEWSRKAIPGLVHGYSNTNYVVLAQLVETVSGLPFREFIHANLIAPFELQRTFIQGGPGQPSGIAKGYFNHGYGLPRFEPSRAFDLETVGDGGMISSLNDLTRWQSLFWSGAVVDARSLSRMTTPGTLDSGEAFEYGLGLQIERREGNRTWCGHGGSWTNATTLIGRYPRERATVIVLSNEVMAPVERISQCALSSVGPKG